tara:strand:- start:47 stop:295 length:249 start_codon:yes stop_codon:yes gene_type:complete
MSINELRKYKIFGMAIFDLVVSMIGMIIIFILLKKWHFKELSTLNFIIAAIILTIPFGIIVHILFGVNTGLNYKLGLSYKPK